MKKSSLLLSLLMLVALPAGAQNFGGAVAVGADEILVGETNNQTASGTVYVFGRDGDRWVERARLNASDADGKDDRFGRALALDGDVLVAGATTKDGLKGAAYVFERNADGQWRETAKLSPDDLAEGDYLGRAVAVSGDFIMVSAAGKRESAGAVYVFRREDDGAWRTHSMLTAPEGQPEDLFGLALALDGDKALIAAPFRDENTGAVYAFHYDPAADAWVADGAVEAGGIEKENQFGLALALDGNDALIGAPRFRGNLGAAFVFSYDAEEGTWRQASKLIPFDGEEGRLGSALALDGEEVWLGSPGALGFTGAVYRYHRDGETGRWSGVTKVGGSGAQSQDLFGGAIAVRGDLAVVAATNDDYGAGTAYVFERDAGGTWRETATLAVESESMASITGGKVSCEDGDAAGFDCDNVDLVSFLSVKDIGGGRGVHTNDLWGWTDPETGKEYALVGRTDGTAFVDISDPYHPVYLGSLPLHEGARPATWRDIKVYKNHAYIVSDGAGPHGMQVFDLTQLRSVEHPPVTFTETAHYDKINSAHNIVINEDTGFAFAVGASMGGETCGGGLHMIDIRDPEHPKFAGCFSHTGTGRQGTGYTHDAQCVTYHGPDTEHRGREICFGANETALSIADVTDKAHPVALSQATYPNVGYAHQGWLTEDQRYFFMDDELDELQGKVEGTRTLIWDVSDLEDPQLVEEYVSNNKSSDHNLYIKGNLMYQSNYVSGLRIYDITDVEHPVPVGYFDTVPYGEDAPGFNGSWSNYPYFESGVIVVTSGNEGVFVLKKKDLGI